MQVQDPLVLVPIEKWKELEDILKKHWPSNIQVELLDIHRKWTGVGIEHQLRVYCPFGDFNNGIVTVNNKVSNYEIIILSPTEDTEQIENALRSTKLIDWDQHIEFAFATENIIKCLKRIVDDIQIERNFITELELFIIKRGSPRFDISLPTGLSFRPVLIQQAEYINSVWPHKHNNSTAYIESLIRAGMGSGLYNDQALLGWVFIRENGPLLHLYVDDEHRRKGYGALLLKYITNVLLDRDKDCFAYCVAGNDRAAALYRKLNFWSGGKAYFCHFYRSK